jgi:Flp pilus assembly protein TadG
VVLPFVALMLFVLIGFAAFAVDLANIYGVNNELHNAADAGALAGARFLYNSNGTQVNSGANQIAYNAATANNAQSVNGIIAVDVNWSSGQNTGANVDVQRGHWSFATKTFTANDTLTPPDLWNRTTAELDADPNFINAVKVTARRQTSPVASFFARLFGFNSFQLAREAVAYLGFAGTLAPGEADQPIAICRQSLLNVNDEYTCIAGRMINSGSGTTHNSGAWTNFSQPCETASVPSVRPLVCGNGNPVTLNLGDGMGTTGGMQDNVYNDLRDCWLNNPNLAKDPRGYPMQPWSMTLPVVDCPGNNPGPCSTVVGAVVVDVVWIKQSGTDPHWNDIPVMMDVPGNSWVCEECTNDCGLADINALTEAQRITCWQDFLNEYNLLDAVGTSASDLTASDVQKTMFILPSCEPHELSGTTGGENFGVLARIPVLVK